jgi:hypothetical protein
MMPRGGKRLGAGRPKGSSKYKEATKMARIPASLANEIVRVAAHGHQPVVADAKALEGALSSFEDGLKRIQNLKQTHELAEATDEIQRGMDLIREILGIDIPMQISVDQQEQTVVFKTLSDYSEQHILSLNRGLLSTRRSLGTGFLSKGSCLESSNLFSVLEIEKLHHDLGFVKESKGTKKLVLTKTILRMKKVNDRIFKVTHVIHRHRSVYE